MTVRNRRDFERGRAMHYDEPSANFDEGEPEHVRSPDGGCACGADSMMSGTGHGYTLCEASKREI